MRVIIQRVSSASVQIDEQIVSSISQGLLVLAGFEEIDNKEDIEWMTKKVLQLRIFNDKQGIMNLSVKDISGEVLVVSQFTLYASTKKGNRPSYIRSAKPDIAIPLYEQFVKFLTISLGKEIQTGDFGADMKISMENNGPVTILIDSKNKE